MLVTLLAILVIECVAFNMPFWTTLGASTDSAAATNVMGDGLKRGEDGILTVTDPTSAYMEVSADGTSSYVRIEAANTPEGGDVKAASNVFVRADTDSRTGEITSVSTSAPRSLYLKVKPGSSVRLWIEEPVGSRIPFSAVRANVRVPFEFSWLRVSIMAAVALLVALWRPGSALWRIRLNPASVRQRWALMAFLAPLAIYTTVRIVGEFLVSGPLVFPNPHGYTYDFDQYDHVAQSLLNGRVWLDLPVSPELAQAANPHDILVRSQLFESGKTQIFWDYAFYGGHWYSYFGVVPVVLFFLPFRAITSLWTPGGMMLPTSVCILLMMFLFAVFACLLVIRLTHRLCPNASVAATSIVIVMFLLGSNASYLHFRLNFYSVPFAASLMFTTLGLWLWLKATPERHPGRGEHVHVGSWSVAGAQPLSLRYLAAGAACIAANFGCRPTFALSALLCFPIFWPQITSLLQGLKSRSLPPRRALRAPAAVIIPALIVVLPLMAYNVARFGSPLDFGNDYQMTVTDMTRFVQPVPAVAVHVGVPLHWHDAHSVPRMGLLRADGRRPVRDMPAAAARAGGPVPATQDAQVGLLGARHVLPGPGGAAGGVRQPHRGPGMALHLRFRVDDGDRRAGADAVSHASRWRRDRGWCARSVGTQRASARRHEASPDGARMRPRTGCGGADGIHHPGCAGLLHPGPRRLADQQQSGPLRHGRRLVQAVDARGRVADGTGPRHV